MVDIADITFQDDDGGRTHYAVLTEEELGRLVLTPQQQARVVFQEMNDGNIALNFNNSDTAVRGALGRLNLQNEFIFENSPAIVSSPLQAEDELKLSGTSSAQEQLQVADFVDLEEEISIPPSHIPAQRNFSGADVQRLISSLPKIGRKLYHVQPVDDEGSYRIFSYNATEVRHRDVTKRKSMELEVIVDVRPGATDEFDVAYNPENSTIAKIIKQIELQSQEQDSLSSKRPPDNPPSGAAVQVVQRQPEDIFRDRGVSNRAEVSPVALQLLAASLSGNPDRPFDIRSANYIANATYNPAYDQSGQNPLYTASWSENGGNYVLHTAKNVNTVRLMQDLAREVGEARVQINGGGNHQHQVTAADKVTINGLAGVSHVAYTDNIGTWTVYYDYNNKNPNKPKDPQILAVFQDNGVDSVGYVDYGRLPANVKLSGSPSDDDLFKQGAQLHNNYLSERMCKVAVSLADGGQHSLSRDRLQIKGSPVALWEQDGNFQSGGAKYKLFTQGLKNLDTHVELAQVILSPSAPRAPVILQKEDATDLDGLVKGNVHKAQYRSDAGYVQNVIYEQTGKSREVIAVYGNAAVDIDASLNRDWLDRHGIILPYEKGTAVSFSEEEVEKLSVVLRQQGRFTPVTGMQYTVVQSGGDWEVYVKGQQGKNSKPVCTIGGSPCVISGYKESSHPNLKAAIDRVTEETQMVAAFDNDRTASWNLEANRGAKSHVQPDLLRPVLEAVVLEQPGMHSGYEINSDNLLIYKDGSPKVVQAVTNDNKVSFLDTNKPLAARAVELTHQVVAIDTVFPSDNIKYQLEDTDKTALTALAGHNNIRELTYHNPVGAGESTVLYHDDGAGTLKIVAHFDSSRFMSRDFEKDSRIESFVDVDWLRGHGVPAATCNAIEGRASQPVDAELVVRNEPLRNARFGSPEHVSASVLQLYGSLVSSRKDIYPANVNAALGNEYYYDSARQVGTMWQPNPHAASGNPNDTHLLFISKRAGSKTSEYESCLHQAQILAVKKDQALVGAGASPSYTRLAGAVKENIYSLSLPEETADVRRVSYTDEHGKAQTMFYDFDKARSEYRVLAIFSGVKKTAEGELESCAGDSAAGFPSYVNAEALNRSYGVRVPQYTVVKTLSAEEWRELNANLAAQRNNGAKKEAAYAPQPNGAGFDICQYDKKGNTTLTPPQTPAVCHVTVSATSPQTYTLERYMVGANDNFTLQVEEVLRHTAQTRANVDALQKRKEMDDRMRVAFDPSDPSHMRMDNVPDQVRRIFRGVLQEQGVSLMTFNPLEDSAATWLVARSPIAHADPVLCVACTRTGSKHRQGAHEEDALNILYPSGYDTQMQLAKTLSEKMEAARADTKKEAKLNSAQSARIISEARTMAASNPNILVVEYHGVSSENYSNPPRTDNRPITIIFDRGTQQVAGLVADHGSGITSYLNEELLNRLNIYLDKEVSKGLEKQEKKVEKQSASSSPGSGVSGGGSGRNGGNGEKHTELRPWRWGRNNNGGSQQTESQPMSLGTKEVLTGLALGAAGVGANSWVNRVREDTALETPIGQEPANKNMMKAVKFAAVTAVTLCAALLVDRFTGQHVAKKAAEFIHR